MDRGGGARAEALAEPAIVLDSPPDLDLVLLVLVCQPVLQGPEVLPESVGIQAAVTGQRLKRVPPRSGGSQLQDGTQLGRRLVPPYMSVFQV